MTTEQYVEFFWIALRLSLVTCHEFLGDSVHVYQALTDGSKAADVCLVKEYFPYTMCMWELIPNVIKLSIQDVFLPSHCTLQTLLQDQTHLDNMVPTQHLPQLSKRT